MTARDAAERLGVPYTTLKDWLRQLQVPGTAAGDRGWEIDESAIGILERVRDGRAKGIPLGLIADELARQAEAPADTAPPDPSPVALVRSEVAAAVTHLGLMLDERVGQAEEIGRLRERVDHLAADRDRLAGELAAVAERERAAAAEAAEARVLLAEVRRQMETKPAGWRGAVARVLGFA